MKAGKIFAVAATAAAALGAAVIAGKKLEKKKLPLKKEITREQWKSGTYTRTAVIKNPSTQKEQEEVIKSRLRQAGCDPDHFTFTEEDSEPTFDDVLMHFNELERSENTEEEAQPSLELSEHKEPMPKAPLSDTVVSIEKSEKAPMEKVLERVEELAEETGSEIPVSVPIVKQDEPDKDNIADLIAKVDEIAEEHPEEIITAEVPEENPAEVTEEITEENHIADLIAKVDEISEDVHGDEHHIADLILTESEAPKEEEQEDNIANLVAKVDEIAQDVHGDEIAEPIFSPEVPKEEPPVDHLLMDNKEDAPKEEQEEISHEMAALIADIDSLADEHPIDHLLIDDNSEGVNEVEAIPDIEIAARVEQIAGKNVIPSIENYEEEAKEDIKATADDNVYEFPAIESLPEVSEEDIIVEDAEPDDIPTVGDEPVEVIEDFVATPDTTVYNFPTVDSIPEKAEEIKPAASEEVYDIPSIGGDEAVVEETAEVEEAPVIEETAEVEEAPVIEEVAEVEETPVVEETAEVEEAPVIEEVAEVEEAPVIEEVAEVEEPVPAEPMKPKITMDFFDMPQDDTEEDEDVSVEELFGNLFSGQTVSKPEPVLTKPDDVFTMYKTEKHDDFDNYHDENIQAQAEKEKTDKIRRQIGENVRDNIELFAPLLEKLYQVKENKIRSKDGIIFDWEMTIQGLPGDDLPLKAYWRRNFTNHEIWDDDKYMAQAKDLIACLELAGIVRDTAKEVAITKDIFRYYSAKNQNLNNDFHIGETAVVVKPCWRCGFKAAVMGEIQKKSPFAEFSNKPISPVEKMLRTNLCDNGEVNIPVTEENFCAYDRDVPYVKNAIETGLCRCAVRRMDDGGVLAFFYEVVGEGESAHYPSCTLRYEVYLDKNANIIGRFKSEQV